MKILIASILVFAAAACTAEAKGKKSKPTPVAATQPAPAPAPVAEPTPPAPQPSFMDRQIAAALASRPSVGTYSAAAALQSGGIEAAEAASQGW